MSAGAGDAVSDGPSRTRGGRGSSVRTEDGRAALAAWRAAQGDPRSEPESGPPAGDVTDPGPAATGRLDRATLAAAVRHTLGELTRSAPGRSVEVRVPPYAAVQCVTGPRHTRGTPPNTVETDAGTWLQLATGTLRWADALATGRVRTSGERADLAPYLPVA